MRWQEVVVALVLAALAAIIIEHFTSRRSSRGFRITFDYERKQVPEPRLKASDGVPPEAKNRPTGDG